MSHSPLLNLGSADRCANFILRDVRARGLLPEFQALVQADAGFRNVRFLAFNLLEASAPFACFLPAPSCDSQDFLQIYEEFSDRPLGGFRNPGAVAGKIYKSGPMARLLLRDKEHEQWLTPALCLLAAARHFGATVESNTPASRRVNLNGQTLEVTPEGCWSNFRRAIVPCQRRASDTSPLSFTSVWADDPVLRTVFALREDLSPGAEYAAAALALALKYRVVTSAWLWETLLEAPGTYGGRAVRHEAGGVGIHACEEILLGDGADVVRRLYQAAVPDLLTSKEFQHWFGGTSRSSPNRRVSQQTRRRWLDILEARLCAVT